MLILAIDLGQSKSVYCVFESSNGSHEFGSFTTTSGQLRKLLGRIKPARVVVEACPLAALVHDVADALGIRTLIADPSQDAWQWKNTKRKTDRDDALKLASLAALGQLNLVHMPSRTMRQWRQLLKAREAAVAEQTRSKIRIRALLRPLEITLPRGKCGWTAAALAALREQACPLKDCSPEELWRGTLQMELERIELLETQVAVYDERLTAWAAADARVRRVATIPGVGVVTAATIVAILDDPQRFRSRRPVASYAGLTPRRYQSGGRDPQGRISKRGSALLRHVLNQAAWMAVRYNPALRAFYLRLSHDNRRGKRTRAIVAVMHKLLVIAWAMLRDERPYRPASVPPTATAA
jgi:transposase